MKPLEFCKDCNCDSCAGSLDVSYCQKAIADSLRKCLQEKDLSAVYTHGRVTGFIVSDKEEYKSKTLTLLNLYLI
jgi:hypothetical protein